MVKIAEIDTTFNKNNSKIEEYLMIKVKKLQTQEEKHQKQKEKMKNKLEDLADCASGILHTDSNSLPVSDNSFFAPKKT